MENSIDAIQKDLTLTGKTPEEIATKFINGLDRTRGTEWSNDTCALIEVFADFYRKITNGRIRLE